MKKQPIFVAVDTNNIKRATQIVNATNKYIYGVKFGLEFFCSKGGREAIKKFKNKNKAPQKRGFVLRNNGRYERI